MNAFLALKSEDLGKAKDEIEASIKIQPYFYNLYIGSQIYKELGDTVRFIECTDQALKMNDRFDNLLYNSIKEKIGNPAEELDLVTSFLLKRLYMISVVYRVKIVWNVPSCLRTIILFQ